MNVILMQLAWRTTTASETNSPQATPAIATKSLQNVTKEESPPAPAKSEETIPALAASSRFEMRPVRERAGSEGALKRGGGRRRERRRAGSRQASLCEDVSTSTESLLSSPAKCWRHREPPRGVGGDSYALCEQYSAEGRCKFGSQCVEAHSDEELGEWRLRFDVRRRQARSRSGSFVDAILEELNSGGDKKVRL